MNPRVLNLLNPEEVTVMLRLADEAEVDEGLDHGVGHPLLLLYDVQAPNSQNSNEFKALYNYISDVSLRLFSSKSKYIIYITI